MVGSFPQSIYWLPEKEGLNKVFIYELCTHLKVLKLACLLLTLCNNILLDLFVCTVFFAAGTVPGNQICFFYKLIFTESMVVLYIWAFHPLFV